MAAQEKAMLKRIHIKNFRSCKDVVLDNLGSMTALVGRNGSGKTNILKAIELLARAASATDLFKASRVTLAGPITADFQQDEKLYRYHCDFGSDDSDSDRQRFFRRESLAVLAGQDKWNQLIDRDDKVVHIKGRQELKIGASAPCLLALAGLLPEEDDLLQPIDRLLQFMRGIRYYPLDETNEHGDVRDWFGIVPAKLYQEWLSEYQTTGDAGESVVVRLLHAYYEQRARFDELFSLLGPRGLGLLQAIEISPPNAPFEQARKANLRQFYVVAFRVGRHLGGGQRPLTYGDLSLGTRRIIHLLATLILDDTTLKLIEHPEDCIHRGLVRQLIELLRVNADPAQIIMSSHSAVVLNDLAPEDVRLVFIQNGCTKVRALTPKEQKLAAGYIDDEGTLAEFIETIEG